uniref:Uncharacterized protein n=1 Tax=Kwoniella dejecticola CBS 10117 TaxID=1296121 RepID=A0A1A6AEX9_9TREE|nr:uncharacterized protein I303_00449 [Kwoniella dejecticola CBS 10117]OBR88632.1 hypothetical protein I303_00449 [Kwoniella dejecticola CBS 10117]
MSTLLLRDSKSRFDHTCVVESPKKLLWVSSSALIDIGDCQASQQEFSVQSIIRLCVVRLLVQSVLHLLRDTARHKDLIGVVERTKSESRPPWDIGESARYSLKIFAVLAITPSKGCAGNTVPPLDKGRLEREIVIGPGHRTVAVNLSSQDVTPYFGVIRRSGEACDSSQASPIVGDRVE